MLINGSFLLLFLALISFIVNRKHLLSVLLSLEFVMITVFFSLTLLFSYFSYESYFLMVFLTFAVCEGSLDLSILVSMVRTHGNDYFNSFNILW